MERDEALTALRLSGNPSSADVDKAFREREYEIEQKLITAPPEEGVRITLDFERDRVEEARKVLTGLSTAERPERPSSAFDADTPPRELPPAGPDTVKLALPPASSPFRAGGGGRLKSIGAWAVRILALVAVLAGVFIYLTQFGPLTGWWSEFTRDTELMSRARSLKDNGENLARQWAAEAGLLRVEEHSEIKYAHRAIERGDALFAECRDEPAITSYLEAKGRLEVGLEQLAVVRQQLKTQGEQTAEEIRNLFKKVEKKEWGLDRKERDASEEVHRIEENLKASRSREDRRRIEVELQSARKRLALARDVQGACRRSVFESDRLPEVQEKLALSISSLEEEDIYGTSESLLTLKAEMEAMLLRTEELDRTVQELWGCEQLLTAAKAQVSSADETLFVRSTEALAELRKNLDGGDLDDVREGLPAIRAAIEGIERLLPQRNEVIQQAGRLTSARRFPELKQKLADALAGTAQGDEALLEGRAADAEKAYEDAGKAVEAVESETKNALLALARENAGRNGGRTSRSILDELLRLDPLNADAGALRKKLSGQRETRAIVVPDDVRTLQAALLAAKPGEVIRIRPGVYQGGVSLKDGVRIEGAGADRVTIRCGAKEANVIKVKNCRSGSISGVTLEHLGTDLDDHRFSCLHIESSSIQVRNVAMRNAAGNGILITGGGSATVSGCVIQGSGWFGIYFAEHGAGAAVGNICSRNAFSGIAVVAKGKAVDVKRNQCRNNGLHGVYFGEGARGHVENNTVEHNRGSGIAVRGAGANPTLTDNKCRDNRQFGIYFDGGAGGTADRNVCTENDYSGIAAVASAGTLSLRRNKCVGNRRDGIYLFDGARGTAEENVCERNEDSGIAAIGTHSSLVLRRNRCINNKTWGIYFGGSAGGRAEGNVCERNTRDGIAVAEAGTRTTIRSNRCAANRGDGIHFAKGTGGIAAKNVCEKNQGYGLYADLGSSVRVSETSARNNNLGNLGGKAK